MSTNYKFYDSCGDTTTTTGTGTLTLTGTAPTGYNSIVANASDGDKLAYREETSDGVNWEVRLGVYAVSGTTLSKGTLLASSNGGSAVNFGSGTKNVYIVQPAEFMSASVLTTAGDLLTHDGTQPTRLAKGTDGALLTTASGAPSWLAAGTDTYVLTMNSGAPAWEAPSGGGSSVQSGYWFPVVATPYFGSLYAALGGGFSGDPTTGNNADTAGCIVIPKSGTVSDLEIVTQAQPGSAVWTFTFVKNGSSQSVVASMTGAVNTASDHTHSFSVSVGDRIAILFATTGADPGGTSGLSFSFVIS